MSLQKLPSCLAAEQSRRLHFEALEDRRLLAVLSVDNLNDAGAGSLRQAILDANGIASVDTITFGSLFGAQQTIPIGSPLPTITDDLTIAGPGQDLVTIDAGDGTDNNPATGDGYRIFNIEDGDDDNDINVNLIGLTLTGGDLASGGDDRDGGAIHNAESLSIISSTISGNWAGFRGGGIYNSGTATLTTSVLGDNRAAIRGGGIYTSETGTANIIGSTVTGNNAPSGGGVYNTHTTNITDSTISNNTAGNRGGGVHNGFGSTTLNITGSTISNNTAGSRGGGVNNNRGTANITGSTISGNTIGFRGGGIANFFGTINITSSTISGNTSTLIDAGGIYNRGTANIAISTISGNKADRFGGGIQNGGTLRITGSTISGNSAAEGGGGIFNATETTLTLNNTIVAENTGELAENDLSNAGDISGAFNLIGDGTGQSGIVHGINSNQVGTSGSPIDPLLGPLADNGGPTRTHALLPDSPALDAGSSTEYNDQRGERRIADGDDIAGALADIGAYEAQSAPSADFVDNDFIDGGDFLAWQRGFGTAVGAVRSDGNSDDDGDVDGSDLAAWAATFGQVETTPLVAAVRGGQQAVAVADLIDIALATEWLGVAIDERQPSLDTPSKLVEHTTDNATSTDDIAPAVRAPEDTGSLATRSPEADEAADPWLSDEMLERVFD